MCDLISEIYGQNLTYNIDPMAGIVGPAFSNSIHADYYTFIVQVDSCFKPWER
jgi:hypothetical protein